MTDLPGLILAILGGATRERPCSIVEIITQLVNLYGILATDRQIKAAILTLRKRDVLIGSSKGKPHGYWIATPEEAEEAALSMWRQAISMIGTARGMLRTLTPARRLEIEGQMRLDA